MTSPLKLVANPPEDALTLAACDLFKCLSDPTRLRLLLILRCQGELCVCDLMHLLDASQPKVSRHLARLKSHKLLQDARRGQWIYYRLHPDVPDWVKDILQHTAQALPQVCTGRTVAPAEQ